MKPLRLSVPSLPRRRLPWLAAVLAALAAALLPAQATPVKKGAVAAELVAADSSIQPGQAFTVALRLQHDPHWHSYWLNAGTGYPTSLTWTLPDGFKAGLIQWPTPQVVRDTLGHITGNGYEGEVFLLVDITPPAALATGGNITLRAKAEWLMCSEVCMPGDAALELTLPVKNEPPAPDANWAAKIAAARKELPQEIKGAQLTAFLGDTTVKLAAKLPAGLPAGDRLHFFSDDALIDHAIEQKVAATPDGVIMTLPISDAAEPKTARLVGVLRSETGWGPGGRARGLRIDIPFSAPPAADPAATGGLLGTLLLAFVGGLILNLMPCVFPVLGIKILGFVNQSGSDRRKVALHGLTFAAGVFVSFWALAGLLIALRAGGQQLGWGFQLQSPAFVFGMAVFLLIFALNLSGLFEVGLSATGVGGRLQMKEGFAGSFFTGILATLVATPCSAPFLAPALGAALTLSAFESLIVFTAIALGLALPYLLLSIFPGAVKLLPRPGAWMETFKQLMAFPLYATVGWLLWVLAGQTKDDDHALLSIAFAFVLVAMAGWAYGRFGQTHGKPGRQLFGRALAGLLLVLGLWVGWPEEAPVADAKGGYPVVWGKWSPEAVADLRAKGKFIYVDFTARWCATCQTNKAAVFHSPDVLAAFGQRGAVLLRADWTKRDPQITAELAKWRRSAVPFNLLYAPGKKDPVVLPELLTPGRVLDALAQAEKPR